MKHCLSILALNALIAQTTQATAVDSRDTKEYSATYDAVPYPDDEGFGLKGAYTLWKKYNKDNSFMLTFNMQLEA